VAVSADDFTIRGGSSEAYLHEKNVQAELMAAEYGLPLLRLLDGTGGGGSVAEIEKIGATYVPYVPRFDQVVANLGRVPVIALGLGPGAGMMDHTRFRYRIAWPSGDWGSLPVEGGLEAAFKSQIEAAADPEAEKSAIRARLKRLRSPFRSAERFLEEEIVPRAETRRWLCEFAQLATRGAVTVPRGFHYRC
jgi:propionyl-CoA carboxylase beta chain